MRRSDQTTAHSTWTSLTLATQPYFHAAHGRRELGAHFDAAQFEHHALGILQPDPVSAAGDRGARTDGAVGPFDISRRAQIVSMTSQICGRGADGGAKTRPTDLQRIVLAAKHQRAGAAADADDEAALGDDGANV